MAKVHDRNNHHHNSSAVLCEGLLSPALLKNYFRNVLIAICNTFYLLLCAVSSFADDITLSDSDWKIHLALKDQYESQILGEFRVSSLLLARNMAERIQSGRSPVVYFENQGTLLKYFESVYGPVAPGMEPGGFLHNGVAYVAVNGRAPVDVSSTVLHEVLHGTGKNGAVLAEVTVWRNHIKYMLSKGGTGGVLGAYQDLLKRGLSEDDAVFIILSQGGYPPDRMFQPNEIKRILSKTAYAREAYLEVPDAFFPESDQSGARQLLNIGGVSEISDRKIFAPNRGLRLASSALDITARQSPPSISQMRQSVNSALLVAERVRAHPIRTTKSLVNTTGSNIKATISRPAFRAGAAAFGAGIIAHQIENKIIESCPEMQENLGAYYDMVDEANERAFDSNLSWRERLWATLTVWGHAMHNCPF